MISLISFAASVILTRLFLQITGYPQLGSETLHIAHVLWGGLLLFIAALLPLILANRWVFNTSAVLSGVGVGLFIDEVGKFITQTNDYFYPPAAPIIYAFFLLTVLLYLQVRRPPDKNPRGELYRILEGLTEVLDHDLDPLEREALEARLLQTAGESDDHNLQHLAHALVSYLKTEQLHLVKPRTRKIHQLERSLNRFFQKHITRPRLKAILVFALGGMGVLALIEFIKAHRSFLVTTHVHPDGDALGALIEFSLLLWAIPAPQPAIESLIGPMVTKGELRSAGDALWFLVRTILEGGTGFMLVIAGGMLVVGQEQRGIRIATLALIVWLTVINLLVFYFDQFGAVVAALFQFLILLVLAYYRGRYLAHAHPNEPPASV